MNWSRTVKDTLYSLILKMQQNRENYVVRPGKDFTRSRKLSFFDVMLFMVISGVGTTRSELLGYFNYDIDTPTASALIQRRSCITLNAFRDLLKEINEVFVPDALHEGTYQLIACDGTSFTISRDETDPDTYHPPTTRSKRGHNSVHLISLYDILEKRFLDAVLQGKRSCNEYEGLCMLVDRCKPYKTGIPLFVADRGFASYNVFAHLIENERHFLIRARDIQVARLLGCKDLADEEFDTWIELILTRSKAQKWRDPEKQACNRYRLLRKSYTFDYLDESPGATYTMKLRIARFKLPSGEWENVITNVSKDEFDLEDLACVYNLRWGIELAFRDYKHTIGAGELRSAKFSFVEQELLSSLILYNLCTIIAGKVVVAQDSKRKYVYQIDFTLAAKICMKFLKSNDGRSPPDVEKLIALHLQPVRPGRKFNRYKTTRSPSAFTYRFA